MKDRFLITIKAEDRPGLLHLVTGMVEKRLVKIISLSLAPTDIHDIVLITIEVRASQSHVTQLSFKLENIIEVFVVEVKQYNDLVCLRAAYFKLSKAFLESPKAIALSNFNTTIVNIYPDSLLIAKYGTDETIQKLYNLLDGPHMLGFGQTGLITDSSLTLDGDIERIRQLAA